MEMPWDKSNGIILVISASHNSNTSARSGCIKSLKAATLVSAVGEPLAHESKAGALGLRRLKKRLTAYRALVLPYTAVWLYVCPLD
jgi:hypothetical protein